jgi:hypothetical protein
MDLLIRAKRSGITALAMNDTYRGVCWSLAGPGSLSNSAGASPYLHLAHQPSHQCPTGHDHGQVDSRANEERFGTDHPEPPPRDFISEAGERFGGHSVPPTPLETSPTPSWWETSIATESWISPLPLWTRHAHASAWERATEPSPRHRARPGRWESARPPGQQGESGSARPVLVCLSIRLLALLLRKPASEGALFPPSLSHRR